ncbi:hypothetical protein AB2B38_010370 [Balneola sp. MJW-20]|uniref:hypothetical protein n=1 Tax=Gracilimonas aurantiaca TaxID=3234185 RepID=UPI00346654E4
MSHVIRSSFFVAAVILLSACATTSSNITIDEEFAARNMASLSSIEVWEQVYYPVSETDIEPELTTDRDYLTDSIGSRGGGQQVVKRKPAETVRYGLMISKKGRVDKVIPLEVSNAKLIELQESYRNATYKAAIKDGVAVNSYVIIIEQF